MSISLLYMNLKIGDCLFWKDDSYSDDTYKVFRILDIEDDTVEAYQYEISYCTFYRGVIVSLELPLSDKYRRISVEVHDKITKIARETINSIGYIFENVPTAPITKYEKGSCILVIDCWDDSEDQVLTFFRLDIPSDDPNFPDAGPHITLNSEAVICSNFYLQYREENKDQKFSIPRDSYEKAEKIFKISRMTVLKLLKRIEESGE